VGKKAWLLQLWVQAGGLSSVEDRVAEQVVPAGAVSAGTTNQRVISKAVEHPTTQRTLDIPISERDSQSPPKHANEESWFVVKLRRLGGRGVHVHTGPFGTHKVEVLTLRPAGGVAELGDRALVHRFRELLLGKLLRAKLLQLVVAVDSLGMGVEGDALRGKAGTVDARGLQRVVWVQFLAELNTAGPGSKKGGVRVFHQGAQTKTSTVGAERGLCPLMVVRM